MTMKHGLIVSVLVALLVGIVTPAFRAAHEATCRRNCSINLKQIAVALDNYHDTYHSLPIAVERTSKGKLWRSWRTQIFPVYMEQIGMFYETSSAWDSPRNLRLLNGQPVGLRKKDGTPYELILDRVPWAFACPTSKETGRTGSSYVVVTGSETAFPHDRGIALSEIRDGAENTILVVESITSRPDWTEPRDLEFATMSYKLNDKVKPSISSDHIGGAQVCFADGEVAFLSSDISEQEVRALLTVAGGEKVYRHELIRRGVITLGFSHASE